MSCFVSTKKASPRRVLVNFKDLLKLRETFSIYQDGRQTQTIDMGICKYPLSCVNVSNLRDKVIWAHLNGRKSVCPLIKLKDLPESSRNQKTSYITVVFKKDNQLVNVFAAYYGELTPRFPDDAKNYAEKEDAIDFWCNHALIIRDKDRYQLAEQPEWAY